jgi:hypothetical protein
VLAPPLRNENLIVSITSLPTIDSFNEGPGDSGLREPFVTASDPKSPAVCRGAPHISHVFSEGWLWKVHRGHRPGSTNVGAEVSLAPLLRPAEVLEYLFSDVLVDVVPEVRLDIAAIAALTMCTSGGLMPQA